MEENNIPRINNFDIIRLLAALQVVFRHSQHHFELEGIYAKIGTYFLNYFPGVPIFFCISGFLIFWSFDRNSEDIKKYFKNRFLRLFPALWFCFLITVGLLLYDAQSSTSLLQNSSFYIWIVGQISFFQFFQDHPYTYYSHINIVNAITHTYPYDDSLGNVVGGNFWAVKMNANANLWATDGIAAAGVMGILFVNLILSYVLYILNYATANNNKLFVILLFLPFISMFLNTSIFTSLLSGGVFLSVLFLLNLKKNI
jgi:hypothetical protein